MDLTIDVCSSDGEKQPGTRKDRWTTRDGGELHQSFMVLCIVQETGYETKHATILRKASSRSPEQCLKLTRSGGCHSGLEKRVIGHRRDYSAHSNNVRLCRACDAAQSRLSASLQPAQPV